MCFGRFGRRRSTGERVIEFLVGWALLAVSVWVASRLVQGIHLDGWKSTVAVALILGLLNAWLKPILSLLSLPLTVLTLGLFMVVINSALLWLTGQIARHFTQIHFRIDHFFWDAVLGVIVISLASWALSFVINPRRIARDVTR